MRIEQTVEVDAPLDRVWALVNDVPRVAPCMPGAALTKVVDERTYEGTVRVKLGPISMSYKGTVVLEEVDEAARSAQLSASGKDVRGGGTARAKVDTRLEALSDTRTRMSVVSDVQLTGKVASFGRGAVSDVSAKLFGQFADCLRETLEAETRAAAPVAMAGTGPAAPATVPGTAGTGAAAAATVPGTAEPAAAAGAEPAAAGTAPAPGATAPAAASPVPAPAAARPLEVGGLIGTVVTGRLKALWAALAGFFRRLFRRR